MELGNLDQLVSTTILIQHRHRIFFSFSFLGYIMQPTLLPLFTFTPDRR